MQNMIGTFPKFNHVSPWAGSYPHKKIQKDQFITFGVIASTGRQTDMQMNKHPEKYNLTCEKQMY